MAPVADIGGNGSAGFIELYRKIPGNEMGCGCETHRAATDHGDWERFKVLS
jgi:hypothetical protein